MCRALDKCLGPVKREYAATPGIWVKAARGALRGTGKERACSCPESRQNGTVYVHGLSLVGLGEDPKEVEERGEPSILGAGSRLPSN